jgi:hypothetical protein
MTQHLLALVLAPTGQGHVAVAYLDPGTGSLLLQAALAALLSVPFILRTRIHSLWLRLRGRRRNPIVDDDGRA